MDTTKNASSSSSNRSSPPPPTPRFATALISRNEERAKLETAASHNIVAALLASIQALPLHESNDLDFKINGSPWMGKAKDVFFALLPSPAVRCGCAQGLASLAQVSINAITLQSSILHSLDEVAQGNLPDGSTRKEQSKFDISLC